MSILPFLWIWLVHKMPEGLEIPVDFREPVVTSLSGPSWQRSDITLARWQVKRLLGFSVFFFFPPLVGLSDNYTQLSRSFPLFTSYRAMQKYTKLASGLYRWLHIMQHCIRTPSKSHSADNAEKMGFWTAKNKQGGLRVGRGNWVNPALKNGDCLKCDYCY